MPLVSVVIPAYNPGSFLERSVGSVLAQTMSELECIVVDDGSVQSLRDHPILDDPRVHYLRQNNQGVSVARNVGASLATARFVAFLDQDDEWLPTKLATQLAVAEAHPEASFVHTAFTWVLPGSAQASRPEEANYLASLGGQCHVCLSSVFVRRERHDAAGGHSPLLTQQQDWAFVLELLRMFGPAHCVPEPLVRYHVHGENASGDYTVAEREARLLLSLHHAVAMRRNDVEASSAIRAGRRVNRVVHGHQALDRARQSLRDHSWLDAAAHSGHAAGLAPSVVTLAVLQGLRARLPRVR